MTNKCHLAKSSLRIHASWFAVSNQDMIHCNAFCFLVGKPFILSVNEGSSRRRMGVFPSVGASTFALALLARSFTSPLGSFRMTRGVDGSLTNDSLRGSTL